MSKLTIRQYKSAIGSRLAARETLASLGLRRPGNVVEREDSATLRGQLRKVNHLVTFEETDRGVEGAKPLRASGVEGAEPLREKKS